LQVADRDISQGELDKIEEWNRERADQDKDLNQLGDMVKDVKKEAKGIGKSLQDIGKRVEHIDKQAAKTEQNLKTTNAKLKDLLEKVRSSDKFCIDIILICICLGLIGVLYNIIKSKMGHGTTTTTPTPVTTL
jgi:t-SNARE complex subunit (syntaxin)